MEFMRARAAELKGVGEEDEEYLFSEEPILRYNDTARGVIDATVWALGREGRPRAVLVLESYQATSIQYELTTAAEPPKYVQARTWRWSPRQSGFAWKTIPDASPPREARTVRRRQIKQLAQDFAASEEYRGQTYHLRLMPQPIHEYEDEERGVLDGAVFVWAHGTNVEILMFLEAQREEGSPPYWTAGFSRLASASLDVKYRDQDFWSSPEQPGGTPTTPYYFRSDPVRPEERAAFAAE